MSEELFRKLSIRAVKNIDKPKPLKMVPAISSSSFLGYCDNEISICREGKTLLVLKGRDAAILHEAKEVLELHFSKKSNKLIPSGSPKHDSEILELQPTKIVNGNEKNNVSPLIKVEDEAKISNSEKNNNVSPLIKVEDEAKIGNSEKNNNVSPLIKVEDEAKIGNNKKLHYTREFLLDLATSDLSTALHKDWINVVYTCEVILKKTMDVFDVSLHRQKFIEYTRKKKEEREAARNPERKSYSRNNQK